MKWKRKSREPFLGMRLEFKHELRRAEFVWGKYVDAIIKHILEKLGVDNDEGLLGYGKISIIELRMGCVEEDRLDIVEVIDNCVNDIISRTDASTDCFYAGFNDINKPAFIAQF